MGALDCYVKGDQKHPLFNRMQRHIDEYNAACDRRTAACPFWRKLLFAIGFRRQFYRWHHREPITKYAE